MPKRSLGLAADRRQPQRRGELQLADADAGGGEPRERVGRVLELHRAVADVVADTEMAPQRVARLAQAKGRSPARRSPDGIGVQEQYVLVPAAAASLKLSTKAFWIGLPGAMKCQSMPMSLHQASMALQVNSVPLSETIEPGLPRRSTIVVSSRPRAVRRSSVRDAPRHSLVTSSTMLRTRKRRPLAN